MTFPPFRQTRTHLNSAWSLVRPYWQSEERGRAWRLLLGTIGLALAMVYINVLLNDWNRDFYNALEEKKLAAFTAALWQFTYLAFTYVAVAIYKIYLNQVLEMRWRNWLTHYYLQRWLKNKAYYQIEYQRPDGDQPLTDNPDQRIADDLKMLTGNVLFLSLGLLSSLVTLVSFIGILWSVSGPITFMLAHHAFTIPGYMVWFAIAYAALGSLIVYKVAKPLIGLEFAKQRYEADFRFGLVRLRENAEGIALYQGEAQEGEGLKQRFERIANNWWQLIKYTKRLNLVTTVYAQFAVIFPFMVAAPRYFSGAITLGVLFQISSAFDKVQDSLSWFVNAFDSLTALKATIDRLTTFKNALDAADAHHLLQNQPSATPLQVIRNNTGALILDQVQLTLPDGQALFAPFDYTLHPGSRVMISGPSGCGKSTLIRAIAGLWPYGAGLIEIPSQAKLFFLPQKPYLPIGASATTHPLPSTTPLADATALDHLPSNSLSLAAALSYPAQADHFSVTALRYVLEQVGLPNLADQLDHHDVWAQRLSPGEQQRLACARAILHKPDYLFLDEATSALDAEAEARVYQLLLETLPQTTLVSIAHRQSVAAFHTQLLVFSPQENASSSRYVIQAS